jgi:hypothetical protein
MHADGLYEIALYRHRQPIGSEGHALLVCRSGRLFGADSRGRIYKGRLRLYAKHAVRKGFLDAIYETPPRAKPRRGTTVDMQNIVSISGEIDPMARSQHTKILVGSRTVAVRITYLGPLP